MSIVSDYSSPVAKEALRRQRIASSLTSILISILIVVLIGLVMALILLVDWWSGRLRKAVRS